MYLGVSSSLEHKNPKDWAKKHVELGLKSVVFPVDYLAGQETDQLIARKSYINILKVMLSCPADYNHIVFHIKLIIPK